MDEPTPCEFCEKQIFMKFIEIPQKYCTRCDLLFPACIDCTVSANILCQSCQELKRLFEDDV